MRLSKAIISIISLLFFTTASGFGQTIGESTLSDLDGVFVSVEEIPNEIRSKGLSSTTVKTNVELQLRKSDITVYDKKEWEKTPSGPALFIEINGVSSGGWIAYSTDVRLSQDAYLTSGKKVFATTYRVPGVVGTTQNVEDISDAITQDVKTFVNDWLATHPE